MGSRMMKGALGGVLLAILIILSQPFHPTQGLIPELTTFLTTIPLWIAAMIAPHNLTPLVEGSTVLVYFTVAGAVVGIAFERKRLWGWLLVITFLVNHYVVYDRFSRKIGEVLQTVLNYFS